MRLSYSIKLIIRDDRPVKANGKYPIYFSVRLNKTVIKIPTGKEVQKMHWDKVNCHALSGCGNSSLLNAYLTKKVSDFNVFVLTQENMGREITVNHVRSFFDKAPSFSFYDFYQEQINLWEDIKKESTMAHYKHTLKILKAFNSRISFGDINLDLVEKFDKYLIQVRGNRIGGRYNRHKNFRSIIKVAIKKELMLKSPYDHFKFKEGDSTREFLTIDEVRKLARCSMPCERIGLERIKDAFLLGCYTGLRFQDVINLKTTHVKSNPDHILLSMQKTEKMITIPIIASAMDILNKYREGSEERGGKYFKDITNQAMNRLLKEVMSFAGVTKRITYHCSRHTFASNHLQLNTNIHYLKDLLGHSSISVTQIYTKSLNEEIYKSMENFGRAYR